MSMIGKRVFVVRPEKFDVVDGVVRADVWTGIYGIMDMGGFDVACKRDELFLSQEEAYSALANVHMDRYNKIMGGICSVKIKGD